MGEECGHSIGSLPQNLPCPAVTPIPPVATVFFPEIHWAPRFAPIPTHTGSVIATPRVRSLKPFAHFAWQPTQASPAVTRSLSFGWLYSALDLSM